MEFYEVSIMLNPTWLKTFTTLIDTGHFTKTADKLFMTQPGVTQHIKKLEEACGYLLIKRDKKSFSITEQGSAVYDYAKRLEKSEQQLLASLGEDDPYGGTVSLSCSGSMALMLYPVLLELQSHYSKLIPQVEAAPEHKILTDILDDRADLGIVTRVPNDARFHSEKLGHEPLCLMLPAKHPATKQPLSVDTLKQLGFIRHPDAAHYFALYFSQFDDPDLASLAMNDVPMTGYVNQLAQILLPVSKGLGFTILPKSTLESFTHREQVTVYPLPSSITESLYLLSKKNRDWPARFKTVKETIEHSIAKRE